MNPCLHFRPLRPAVASDGATTLDLLISVRCPELPSSKEAKRPPLNLALVIDRSGSMTGRKLSYARKAARFVAGELTARDRLAIVAFDDEVTLVMPSTPVNDPQPFLAAINTIHSGGGTALFDGWLAGATQVANYLDPAALNRVLLLSDGQANEGLTDEKQIAEKVAGLTTCGISTSAFGLGRGFDEDLMGAIASAGDGSLAQIESPEQLADLYTSELKGLASTLGRRVSLDIRLSQGAELVDVFNDLARTSAGHFQLPNLRRGREWNVGMRMRLRAWTPNQEIASVHVAWDAPGTSGRESVAQMLTLPVMPQAELERLEADPEVAGQLALLKANRERRRAIEQLNQGDIVAADATLASAVARIEAMPESELTTRELKLLYEKRALLRQDRNLSRKRLSRESLRSSLNVWEGSDDPA